MRTYRLVSKMIVDVVTEVDADSREEAVMLSTFRYVHVNDTGRHIAVRKNRVVDTALVDFAANIAVMDRADAASGSEDAAGGVDEAIAWLRRRGCAELMIHALPVLGPEEWLHQLDLVRRDGERGSQAPAKPG